jgi:Tol biopolymer transport system component
MKKFPIFIILMALLTACKQVVTFPFSTSTLPTKTPSPAGPTSTSISAPTDSDEGLIAFASWKNDDWQIHVMNADGTGDQRVDDRHGYEPNWSPDGKKIIFQYSGLWIADLASGVLTDVPLSVAGNNLPNEYMVKPAWSPDEQWIAFLNESGLEGDLYLVHPDGTNLQRLTTTDDISRDGNLVWSPDGKYIAYSANRDGNIEIYLLDVASAQQGNEYAQQLTETV